MGGQTCEPLRQDLVTLKRNAQKGMEKKNTGNVRKCWERNEANVKKKDRKSLASK